MDPELFFKQLATKPSLLLLDYDGTLAPFKVDRDQAYPYKGVTERLQKLNHLKRSRLCLISGRAVSDFDRLLNFYPLPPIWGSHGLEKAVNGHYLKETLDPKTEDRIEQAKTLFQGPAFEVKPFGVAVHTRGYTIDKGVRPKLTELIQGVDLEVVDFDGGFELRPKGKNKGDVIRELQKNGDLIAYLGDDKTDEDAFAALGDRGLKVLVRPEWRPTLADIHLKPPKELLTFLDRWIEVNHG